MDESAKHPYESHTLTSRFGPGTVESESKAWSEAEGAVEPIAATRPAASPDLAFSTRDLPQALQAEAWRAGNAPSLDLVFNSERPAGSGFLAERQVVSFGPFVMTRVLVDSVTAIRSRGHAHRDGLDHWCINLTTRGDRHFRWDRGDRCLSVPAGRLHVQALDEAYRGFAEDIEWIGIFFARDSLPVLSAHLDATRDQPRTDALSRMLADYLARLWVTLPTMTPDELPRAAEATTAMIRACVCATGEALALAGPHFQYYQRARALSFIRRNLGSSRLAPQIVARALGTSRSQLYRAFEPVGGVAQAIQEERLKAARRLLSKEAEERSIREIAEAVGIFEPSSFSRLFRQSFGMTASELRSLARAADAARGGPAVPRISLADFLD